MKENRNNNHFEKDQSQRDIDSSPRKTRKPGWKRIKKIARIAGGVTLSLALIGSALAALPNQALAKENGMDMYRLYNLNSRPNYTHIAKVF